MYNRYIPQSDGSYRKNRYPDQHPPKQNPPPVPPPEPAKPVPCPSQGGSALGFLKNLLPKEFDTGDLLIVLLLLLMAEQEKDQNCALLTLALYFLM
ncbi:MAG: hypothetical protein IKJ99_01485 [Oscillospiraceae bacterium]|nr:hypothetical protein [Oscillospiraceae bacterium]